MMVISRNWTSLITKWDSIKKISITGYFLIFGKFVVDEPVNHASWIIVDHPKKSICNFCKYFKCFTKYILSSVTKILNLTFQDITSTMNESMNFSTVDWCEDLPFLPEFSHKLPYFVSEVLIFTSGFIGNIVTVCVISCWRKLHTPTFTMIACLAASDAYSLLSFTLDTFTNLRESVICIRGFDILNDLVDLFYLVGRWNASMQLCVLACLRFSAIVYPLKFKTYCTCKAVIVMSLVGSLITLIFSVVYQVIVSKLEVPYIDFKSIYTVNTVISVVLFLVPTSIFTVLHFLKLRALRRSPALNSNSSMKMNVVLIIVLSIYVISSASMMMSFILVRQYRIYFLSSVAKLSFLINCAVNPFIYFFSSPPIVQQFRNIWQGICQKCQGANNGSTQEIEMQKASTTWDWISERPC